MTEPLEKIRLLENEITLKDKEIALLINHTNILIEQSNTLKLLNDYDAALDENKWLYEYVDQLKKELQEYKVNMEEIISVHDKEQQHLNNLIHIKDDTLLTNKSYMKQQDDLISKQNDELIDLNFIIYNQNKELYDYEHTKEEIELLKNHHKELNHNYDKLKKECDETQALNAHYCSLIEEIKTFICNTQKSQYIPLFNPSKIVENLMILFNEKILCSDTNDYEVPPIPKNKRMKKKIDNRS